MRIYDIQPPLAKRLGAAKNKTQKYWRLLNALVRGSRYGAPIFIVLFAIFAGSIISALTAPERKTINAFPKEVGGDWARLENIKKTDLPPDSLETGFNFKNSTFSYRIFAELNLPVETPAGSTNEIITPAAEPEPGASPAAATAEGTADGAEESLPPAETKAITGEDAPSDTEASGAAEEPPASEPPAEALPVTEPVAEPTTEIAPEATPAAESAPPALEPAPPPPAEAPPPTPPTETPPAEPVSFWHRFFGAALGQVFAQSETPEEAAASDTLSGRTGEATETTDTPAVDGLVNPKADDAASTEPTVVTSSETSVPETSSPPVEANLDAGLTEEEPAPEKIFTKRKELELSDFRIREDIPFGSEIKEAALNLSMFFAGTGGENDELLVEYLLDGEWHDLKTFAQNETRSNNTEGGYFSLPLPLDYGTVEPYGLAENLHIRLSALSDNETPLPVFVDAAWLSLDYYEGNGEADEEALDDLPKVEVLSEDIFVSEKDSFRATEEPSIGVNTLGIRDDLSLIIGDNGQPEFTFKSEPAATTTATTTEEASSAAETPPGENAAEPEAGEPAEATTTEEAGGEAVPPEAPPVETASPAEEPEASAVEDAPSSTTEESSTESEINSGTDVSPPDEPATSTVEELKTEDATNSGPSASTTAGGGKGFFARLLGWLDSRVNAQTPIAPPKLMRVRLFDPAGHLAQNQPTLGADATLANIEIPAQGNAFRAGDYRLVAEIFFRNKIYVSSDIYHWGVLAVNTNKATFLPGETAYLQMAVLTNSGHTVCDAPLRLELRDPEGVLTVLKTEDGTITSNSDCGPNNVIDSPDYFARYPVTIPGIYNMTLTNLLNGFEISDSFAVTSSVPFEVERVGPTRIYPPAKYGMDLRVKANRDFSGKVIETVPAGFKISGADSELRATPAGQVREVIWNVSLSAGQETTLRYTFDAPDVSPEFYLLGPLTFIEISFADTIGEIFGQTATPEFQEARAWQIASDAVSGSAVTFYGTTAAGRNLFYATLSGETEGAELTGPATGATNASFVVAHHAPTRDEHMVGQIKTEGRMDVYLCVNGCDATDEATTTDSVNTTSISTTQTCDATTFGSCWRPFDIAYETLSGRAMLAFTPSSTDGSLRYCIWDGNAWTPSQCKTSSSMNFSGSAADGKWVRLIPQGEGLKGSRSNKILMIVSDANSDIFAAVWDGTAWTASTTITQTASTFQIQNFDGAWEETTGDAMVIWSEGTTATTTPYRYKKWYQASSSWDTTGKVLPTMGASNIGHWVTAKTAPVSGSNYIAVITDSGTTVGNNCSTASNCRAQPYVWNGSSWTMGNEWTSLEPIWEPVSSVAVESLNGDVQAYFVSSIGSGADVSSYQTSTNTTFSSITDLGGVMGDDFGGIQLTAHPNTNEIWLTADDIDADCNGNYWNGTGTTTVWDVTGCSSAGVTTLAPTSRLSAQPMEGQGYMVSANPYSPWSLNWRWTDDTTNDTPGSWLASENATATDVSLTGTFRLRFNFAELAATAQSDGRKKLQYATANPELSTTTWSDVGEQASSTIWKYANCSAGADDGAVATTTLSSSTQVGDFIEDGDAAITITHNTLGIIENDYCFQANNPATSTTYYFRAYDNQQLTPVFRQQTSFPASPCNGAACLYPALTTEAGTISVTGRIFSDEGTTGATSVVAMVINGTSTKATTTTDGSGNFTFSNVVKPLAGIPITVWMDNATAARSGATITRYSGSGTSTLNIYTQRLIVRHEDGGPITNNNLGQCDKNGGTQCADADLHFDVTTSTNVMTVDNDWRLYIWSGSTFSPGATTTLAAGGTAASLGGDLKFGSSTSILSAAANPLIIGGDWINDAQGTFSKDSGQLTTFTATTTGFVISGTSTFEQLTFAGVSGSEWTPQNQITAATTTFATGTVNFTTNDPIFDVNGSVTINTNGVFIASNSATTTIAGNWTNSGLFTSSGGTITFDGIATSTLSGTLNGTSAFGNVVFAGSPATSGFSTTSDITTSTDVAAGITIDSTYMYILGSDGASLNHIQKRNLSDGVLIATATTSLATNGDFITNDGTYLYVAGFEYYKEKRNLSDLALVTTTTTGPTGGADFVQTMTDDGTYLYLSGFCSSGGAFCMQKSNMSDLATVTTTLSASQGSIDSAVDNTYWYQLLTVSGITKDNKSDFTSIYSTSTAGVNNRAIAVDGTYMYVAGDSSSTDYWNIEKRNLSDGVLVYSTSSNPTGGQSDNPFDIAQDGTYMYIVGQANSSTKWYIEKRNLSDGVLVYSTSSDPTSGLDEANSIAQDGTYMYVVGHSSSSALWYIEKRLLSDGSFGSSGTSTFVINSPASTTGNLTITGGNVVAPSSSLAISGNYTNSGTFTHSSGTVIFNGSSAQTATGTMTGTSAFNNLTLSNTSGASPGVILGASVSSTATTTISTASEEVQFHATSSGTYAYQFQNFVTNGGGTGTRVKLRSSASGTQWFVGVPGTRSILNTDIKDSASYIAPNIDASDCSNLDSQGNTNWTFSACTIFAGTVFSDEGTTAATSVVALVINGTSTKVTTATDASGNFSFTVTSTPSAGTPVTVWMDNADAARSGATVARYSGSGDLTGFNIYTQRLIVRHEDSGPLINNNLGQCDKNSGNQCNDNDLHFDVTTSTNVMTVDNDWRLYLWAGDTYSPGATTTLAAGGTAASLGGDLKFGSSTSILNATSNPLIVGGDWINDAQGTFTKDSGQLVTFTATTTGFVISGTSTFEQLTFAGVSGSEWTPQNQITAATTTFATGTVNFTTNDPVFDVNGSVTINTNGVFIASNSATTTVAGNWTNNGLFTSSGGTMTFDNTSGTSTLAGTLNGTSAFGNVIFAGTNDTGSGFATSSIADTAEAVAIDDSFIYMAGGDSIDGQIAKHSILDGTLIYTTSSDPGTTDRIYDIAIDASYMYLAGMSSSSAGWWIEKRNLSDGALVYSTSSNPTGGSDQANTIAIDGTYMYVGGYENSQANWRIEKRNLSDGVLVYATTSNPTISLDAINDLAIDGTYMYAIGYASSSGTTARWWIEKRNLSDGALVYSTSSNPTSANDTAWGVAIDASYMYVVGMDNAFTDWRLEKRNLSDGVLVYATTTVLGGGNSLAHDVAVDDNFVYIAGYHVVANWRIEKRAISDGALTYATTSNPGTTDFALDLAIDENFMYVAGTQSQANMRIEKRLLLDGSFGGGASSAFPINSSASTTGNFTVSGGTLVAPSSSLAISGNYTNSGTFTHSTGTVLMTGTAQQTATGTMTGTSAFYNLTILNNGGSSTDVLFGNSASSTATTSIAVASSQVKFTAGKTYQFQNVVFNGQATSTRIELRSATASSSWALNVPGTRLVSNTNVADSNACGQPPDIDASDGTNFDASGNTCWNFNAPTPSLSFSVSSTTADFGTLNLGNSFTATTATALVVSTNAANGYNIRAYETGLMSRTGGGATIANWTGTNAVPTDWSTTCTALGTACGFGYRTNDDLLTQFTTSTLFAGFTTTTPGDIVSTATTTATNETTTITYRISVDAAQKSGVYSAIIRYILTPIF